MVSHFTTNLPPPLHKRIYLDASLEGLGGCYDNSVYALCIPRGFKDYNIAHLEILATQACRRLHFGFRPNTLASYERMFQLFIAFLVVVDLSLPGISTMDVLAFMEYLAQSGMSPDNTTNHTTGIRSMSIVYGINTTPFRDQKIPLFIKSLKINRPLAPVVKILIDQTLLFANCYSFSSLTISFGLHTIVLAGVLFFSQNFQHMASHCQEL